MVSRAREVFLSTERRSSLKLSLPLPHSHPKLERLSPPLAPSFLLLLTRSCPSRALPLLVAPTLLYFFSRNSKLTFFRPSRSARKNAWPSSTVRKLEQPRSTLLESPKRSSRGSESPPSYATSRSTISTSSTRFQRSVPSSS